MVNPARQDDHRCSFGDHFRLQYPHLSHASIHSKVKRAGKYAEQLRADGLSGEKAAKSALAHYGVSASPSASKISTERRTRADPPEAANCCVPRSYFPLVGGARGTRAGEAKTKAYVTNTVKAAGILPSGSIPQDGHNWTEKRTSVDPPEATNSCVPRSNIPLVGCVVGTGAGGSTNQSCINMKTVDARSLSSSIPRDGPNLTEKRTSVDPPEATNFRVPRSNIPLVGVVAGTGDLGGVVGTLLPFSTPRNDQNLSERRTSVDPPEATNYCVPRSYIPLVRGAIRGGESNIGSSGTKSVVVNSILTSIFPSSTPRDGQNLTESRTSVDPPEAIHRHDQKTTTSIDHSWDGMIEHVTNDSTNSLEDLEVSSIDSFSWDPETKKWLDEPIPVSVSPKKALSLQIKVPRHSKRKMKRFRLPNEFSLGSFSNREGGVSCSWISEPLILRYHVENRLLSLSDMNGIKLNVSSETIVDNVNNGKFQYIYIYISILPIPSLACRQLF
jgi:hypothetical protein